MADHDLIPNGADNHAVTGVHYVDNPAEYHARNFCAFYDDLGAEYFRVTIGELFALIEHLRATSADDAAAGSAGDGVSDGPVRELSATDDGDLWRLLVNVLDNEPDGYTARDHLRDAITSRYGPA